MVESLKMAKKWKETTYMEKKDVLFYFPQNSEQLRICTVGSTKKLKGSPKLKKRIPRIYIFFSYVCPIMNTYMTAECWLDSAIWLQSNLIY